MERLNGGSVDVSGLHSGVSPLEFPKYRINKLRNRQDGLSI